METLFEAIKNAIAGNASEEARATGAQACRAILAVLEPELSEPIARAVPVAPASLPTSQIAQLIGTLRGVPAEQLLDLAIAQLRAALPAGNEPANVAPLKFHIVQLPGARK